MSTNIEWARNPDGSKGETWPVVTGCSHAGSPGCDMCYAARLAATRLKHHPRYAGLATISNGNAKWTGEARLNYDVLEQPLHWRKPRMVFVASMGDLFHKDVPYEFIDCVFAIMRLQQKHTYQILTKRMERAALYIHRLWEGLDRAACFSRAYREIGVEPGAFPGWPLPNVWLGVSVENQVTADERREYLRQCPAAVKFVSYEPALGPIDWTGWEFVSQIISGGESGPGARPSHPNWHRATRDFCQANGIAYFFKQWGAFTPYPPIELCRDDNQYQVSLYSGYWPIAELGRHACNHQAVNVYRVGKKRAGHLLDGRTWQEFPGGKQC